jgi:hypothetical protein
LFPLLATGVVDTSVKFAAGVDTELVAKFAISVLDFSKIFKMTLVLFSGAWGKIFNEKNLKQKIS